MVSLALKLAVGLVATTLASRSSLSWPDQRISMTSTFTKTEMSVSVQESQSTFDVASKSDRPIKLVTLIMCAPHQFEFRMSIRETLAEMHSGVTWGNRPVEIHYAFSVGTHFPAWPSEKTDYVTHMLHAEQRKYGDMALLDCNDAYAPGDYDIEITKDPDGVMWNKSDPKDRHGLLYCDYGKSWYVFDWMVKKYPDADIYFNQDDDCLVHWKVALPRFLKNALGSVDTPTEDDVKNIHKLYLGRIHYYSEVGKDTSTMMQSAYHGKPPGTPGSMCTNGETYGLGRDIVHWFTKNTEPQLGFEDLVACGWVNQYDDAHPESPSNREGILKNLSEFGAWVHKVKGPQLYWKCYNNRTHGCTISHHSALNHFQLPEKLEGS